MRWSRIVGRAAAGEIRWIACLPAATAYLSSHRAAQRLLFVELLADLLDDHADAHLDALRRVVARLELPEQVVPHLQFPAIEVCDTREAVLVDGRLGVLLVLVPTRQHDPCHARTCRQPQQTADLHFAHCCTSGTAIEDETPTPSNFKHEVTIYYNTK